MGLGPWTFRTVCVRTSGRFCKEPLAISQRCNTHQPSNRKKDHLGMLCWRNEGFWGNVGLFRQLTAPELGGGGLICSVVCWEITTVMDAVSIRQWQVECGLCRWPAQCVCLVQWLPSTASSHLGVRFMPQTLFPSFLSRPLIFSQIVLVVKGHDNVYGMKD